MNSDCYYCEHGDDCVIYGTQDSIGCPDYREMERDYVMGITILLGYIITIGFGIYHLFKLIYIGISSLFGG